MATVGENSEALPTQLLETWNNPKIRADLLVDGSESINLSIQLSINNPHMQANPDAIVLLAIISMLPGGARHELLPQLAPSIINVPLALATLTRLRKSGPIRNLIPDPFTSYPSFPPTS